VNDPINGTDQDVYIGRNFSILEDGTTTNVGIYSDRNNTTTFNGTEDGTLYIGWAHDDGTEQHLYNVVLDKPADKSLFIDGDPEKESANVSADWYNRLVNIENALTIESGILDQTEHSVRLFGPITIKKEGQLGVYEAGVTDPISFIMLKDADLNINTEEGAVFGNIKMNPAPDTDIISFTSNVYIKRIGYYHGRINLGTYNLKIDYLHDRFNLTNYNISAGSAATEMFYTGGNASDGGVSILVTGNGTYGFPLGVAGKYTPAEVIVTNFSDPGYIQISIGDKVLATTDPGGGDILSYYWRVRHQDFTAVPTVEYNFHYDQSDVDGSTQENNFVPGYVTDEDPYTRNTDGNASGVDDANNIINFDNAGAGFALARVNYTAGRGNRFNGPLRRYYSVTAPGQYDWNVAANWYRDTPDTGPNFVPTDGSIVVIRGGARMNIYSASIADVAVVEFDHDYVTNPTPTSENVPRMQFHANGTYDVGNVKGTGMVSFNATRTINLTGDFGDFGNNTESYYLYFGGNATLNSIPTPIPNLMLESATYTINQDITVNADLIIQGNATVTPVQDIYVKDDIIVGYWQGGTLNFPGTGNAIEITVDDDIDFTQDPFSNPQDRNIIVNNPGVASTLEHNFIVKGDIVHGPGNGYDLDLFNAANRPAVVLEFQGDTTQRYYRTSTSVPDFYRIVVNKGTSQTDTIIFEDEFTLSGSTNGATKALELQNGVLKLDDVDIDIDLSSGGFDFDIPASSCLQISQGTVNVYGDDNGIWLDGKLLIDGGTVDMINGAGNGNNYIEYSASGSAQIELSSGNLWLGSQIRRNTTTEEGILTYNQSGGEIQLGVNDGGEDDRSIFEILNAGSSFTHSAGDIYFVNDYRNNPSIASFYFDPETVNLTSGTILQFGNASTVAGNGDFTVYAGKDLMNLEVNSTNSPSVTLNVVSMTLEENATINAGGLFDANGLDFIIKGDFTNNGSFEANGNTTYFSGSAVQNINGVTTSFYNLTKSNSNQLDFNTDATVENVASFDAGTLADNSNEIQVWGDINYDITHTYGGSGDGIILNGSSQQILTGSGTIGKLTVNNASGIEVPIGNEFSVTGSIQLDEGILNIGKNYLRMGVNAVFIPGNPFSETNMISTNISFTDNGVEKIFPAGAQPAFVFPLGSGGKYTPVTFTISTNGNSTGSITVKGADERHPSIQEDAEAPDPEIVDADNVLQYHWVLKANGMSAFSAAAKMKYDDSDVMVTVPYTVADYITARLLNDGSGNWNKFDVADVDEINNELNFSFANVDDDGIEGDYTAGVDGATFNGAIPDQVPFYETNQSGSWTDGSIWTPNVVGGPRGAMVRINVGDTVTMPGNFQSSYTTEINGVLKVDSTFGHRLGDVTGTGTLYMKRESLPAGYYNDFCSPGGGTLEFGGTGIYDILASFTYVNNLTVSGTNEKRFPNSDLIIYGDLNINGDDATLTLNNDHDQTLTIFGDITKTTGVFDAGFGVNAKVVMNGSSTQYITGDFTGTSAFYHFELDNSNGLILNGPVELDGDLTFTDGIITSTAVNLLSIDNTAIAAVSGQSSTRYVDGPMRKKILSGESFVFPVGDGNRYGIAEVISTTTAGAQYWEVQYYDQNPHGTYDITSVVAPIQTVSNNEYWRVKGPAGGQSHVKVRWDSQSQLPAATDPRTLLHIVEWNGAAWASVGNTVTDNGINDGRIQTDSKVALDEHVYTIGSEDNTPLSTAGFISNDTTICAGGTADLIIECTGNSYWDVDIFRGGIFLETVTINASPYTYNATVAGVYSIDAVRGDNGTVPGNPFGNDITITIISSPNSGYTITPSVPTSYCTGDPGVAVGLDDSDLGVSYQLLLDGNPDGAPVAGDGGAITFGNRTVAGTYTVEAIDDLDLTGSCSEIMTGTLVLSVDPLPMANDQTPTVCSSIGGENAQATVDLTALEASINSDFSGDQFEWFTDAALTNDVTATANSQTIAKTINGGAFSDTEDFYCVVTNTTTGCSEVATVTYTLYRTPETGPQYHINSNWGN
jgi:hypothetical protein